MMSRLLRKILPFEMATEEKKATSDAESKSKKKENPKNKHKRKLKK